MVKIIQHNKKNKHLPLIQQIQQKYNHQIITNQHNQWKVNKKYHQIQMLLFKKLLILLQHQNNINI